MRALFCGCRNPLDETYARAAKCVDRAAYRFCPQCQHCFHPTLDEPVIEWRVERYEAGSDKIGDFTGIGKANEFVVTDRVRQAFENTLRGIQFVPVVMWQDPKLKKSKRGRREFGFPMRDRQSGT